MPPKKSKPEATPQGGRESALRLLSRREHSAAELKYKLSRRGHDDAVASGIVETLADSGWQSDERYAEMLVRNRVAQGYGPLRIRAELEAARVDESAIRLAMASADADWAERAGALQLRKFKQPPENASEWQKQYRFLASRGFEAEQIRTALKRSPPEDLT